MAHIQTFKNLQDKVLRWLDEAGDTNITLALVKDGINGANKKRVGDESWPFMLWDDAVVLNINAGQQNYSLHPEYFRPFYFYNRTQIDYMSEVPEGTLVQSGVSLNDSVSGALRFSLWGRLEVAAQPSSASAISVASSDASDNGTRSVTVRGDTVDGVRNETIACGSTGVVTFTKILKVTKLGTWVGTLTLTAGAVLLLKLFPEEAGRTFQRMVISGIPDANEVIEYRFYRQPDVMVADEDRPDVPTPFEDLLVYDTLLDFAAYNQYDPQVVKLWLMKRDELLNAMRSAYSDAHPLETTTHYTSYIPR